MLNGSQGHKVMALRVDNGGEYNKLEDKIKRTGIAMEYTVPYTPE